MPKIKKENVTIRNNDVHINFTFDIFYSSSDGFYAEIPAVYNEQFDGCDPDTIRELHGYRIYKNTRAHIESLC